MPYNRFIIIPLILNLYIISIVSGQSLQLNQFAAIQNQYQTYFNYLPYISSCNYSQPGIIPGALSLTLLDDLQFFARIQQQGLVQFWGTVPEGYQILGLLPQVIDLYGYQGYILYDSPYMDLHRPIILYSYNQSQILFDYTVPILVKSNQSIILNTVNIVTIQLGVEAALIVDACKNQQQKQNDDFSFQFQFQDEDQRYDGFYSNGNESSNFAYIGNGTFLYVCGLVQAGFTFVIASNDTIVHVGQIFTFQDIGIGSYRLAPNPESLHSLHQKQMIWDCALLSISNQTQLYFIRLSGPNITATSVSQMKMNITLIINRIWGQQVKKQASRWMDLFSNFNISQQLYFPGDITSVFISIRENIFVQSMTPDGISYLCIFDSEGLLYWNVSFTGSIIYYGSQNIFIYNSTDSQVWMMKVSRPIYSINISQFNNTTPNTYSYLNTSIPCQSGQITLNYQILWTTPQYPSAMVRMIDNSSAYSTDSIYGLQVQQRFLIVGPDFKVIPNPPSTIEVVMIDYSSITINTRIIGVVNVQPQYEGVYSLIVATNHSIYKISLESRVQTLVQQPCGFDLISSAHFLQNGSYLITNQYNLTCICNSNFVICTLSQQTNHPMQSKTVKYGNENRLEANQFEDNETIGIKTSFYTLIRMGYIISILTNNTAVLINAKNNQILDSVSIPCSEQDQLNGIIYQRQFYDPFIVLFCQEDSYLFQFIIRQNAIIQQRVVPLYRFTTRSGQRIIQSSQTFVFLEVNPNFLVYPTPPNCCVLRLDLCDYTVSVIAQVIQVRQIIQAVSFANLDIGIFESIGQNGDQTIIKLYLPNKWITFTQLNLTQIVTPQLNILVNFQSPIYNFEAFYFIELTFNLTTSNINISQSERKHSEDLIIKLMPSNDSKNGIVQFTNTTPYNLSKYVCGPLFASYFMRAENNPKELELRQTNVITKSKLIGNVGVQFYQIINPQNWGQSNFSLNGLILFVSIDKMFVYIKVYNNVQMVFLQQFALPEKRCQYYLYSIINQTAANLNSNCQGFDFTLQTPLLTLDYNQTTNTVSMSYIWMTNPQSLRQIYTIPVSGQTALIVGILEGPMNTDSGRLVICGDNGCSTLYVSTRFSFLINYSAYRISQQLYYIMSIDANTIQVFISPTVQQNDSIIEPNCTISYSKSVDQPYCSVLRILNATLNNSFSILSCSNYYYLMMLDFINSQIVIYQKFARYSQCDLYDDYKPYIIQDSVNGLEMLFTQCRQNDYGLKLKEFQTIFNKSIVIYTGFLQIFVMTGPLGPNCQQDSISPIKIIPISSSMDRPLFMAYKSKGIHKFIYSQINGVFIDNFIQTQPYLEVTFRPIQLQYTFPSINFYVLNQFHEKMQQISTAQISVQNLKIIDFVVFALFIIANIVTFICIVCFYMQKKNKRMQQIQFTDGANELYYEDNLQKLFEKVDDKKATSKSKSSNMGRPTQIQMFFVKSTAKI